MQAITQFSVGGKKHINRKKNELETLMNGNKVLFQGSKYFNPLPSDAYYILNIHYNGGYY